MQRPTAYFLQEFSSFSKKIWQPNLKKNIQPFDKTTPVGYQLHISQKEERNKRSNSAFLLAKKRVKHYETPVLNTMEF